MVPSLMKYKKPNLHVNTFIIRKITNKAQMG